MERGVIPQDFCYPIRWIPDNEKIFKKKIKLSSFLKNKKCVAYMCSNCNKILIDLSK